jgi:hypothetical protein
MMSRPSLKHTFHLNSNPISWSMNPSPSNYQSSSNQASFLTQGETQIPAVTNTRNVAVIMRETKALIVLLHVYLKWIEDEFK